MAVRYDKKFMAEINSVINAYNRKITRLSKMDTGYILPTKFTKDALSALKETAASRKEVRRRLKELQRFSARGGEKNIKVGKSTIPKYKYQNIKSYQRLLKYRTTTKMKKYETTHPISNGKTEPFTFAQYGSGDYLTLKTKKAKLLDDVDISSMSQKELDMYLHKLRVNTKDYDLDLWQNNYIDILQDTALSYGYDTDKLEILVERLKRLNPEKFDDLAFVNNNIRQVLTAYKALLNIETWKELNDVSGDVISNLDSIYENLDDILSEYE